MNRQRSSVRSSRGSNSTNGSDPKEKMKDCCRKLAAFMCTQVGVGALIVGYAIIGAAIFQGLESKEENYLKEKIESNRNRTADYLWSVIEQYNTLNNTAFVSQATVYLMEYQTNFTQFVKQGYQEANAEDLWTFPASLMFCLSVFSMIGYGNLVPKTSEGKIMTMIYAAFGIPLYVLYFVSMGKVLASTFKWLYTWLHDCSDKDMNGSEEGSAFQLSKAKKKIIVPSTACLWVISFYIAGGTITFYAWENWSYYDAAYFVVISLCKIGFGDFVPGSSVSDKGSNGKLVINFIFILFGMGLVAMCYILMREEVREKFREMKEDANLCMEDITQKLAKCFGTTNREDEFDEKFY